MNQQFQKLGNQVQEIWKQLGTNQRISIIVAGVAVFAVLLAVGLWSGRTDYALLYGKLSDTEAARVSKALEEANVPYRISPSGNSISIPSDQVHRMRMQLASQGIPRGEGVGFEIFDKPNFGISDFVQRANYIRALQGELGRTISQLDEVEAARVLVVSPENRLLIEDNRKPTASVFIKVRGISQLPRSSVDAIQFLVANAVEGLKLSDVSVVDNLGNVLSDNNPQDSLSGLTQTQLKARQELEHYLSRKAEGMLEKVLGPGQTVVRVAADIDWDTSTRTEERYDPDSQVARTETIEDETTDNTTASPSGGAAGLSAHQGPQNSTNIALVPRTSSTTKKKTTSNEYEINKTTSNNWNKSLKKAAAKVKKL